MPPEWASVDRLPPGQGTDPVSSTFVPRPIDPPLCGPVFPTASGERSSARATARHEDGVSSRMEGGSAVLAAAPPRMQERRGGRWRAGGRVVLVPSEREAGDPTPTSARTREKQARRLPSALSREVGVATEMLLTKAEQVSDDGACAAGLHLEQPPVSCGRC
jgi:hypothetical protein